MLLLPNTFIRKKKNKRRAFTFGDFIVKTGVTFLSVPLCSVFSHHSLKQPAMQFVSSGEKNVLYLILIATHLLLVIFCNFFPPKQPQDFAYGSQPTNSFDCSVRPAILAGNFTVVGISKHMSTCYKLKNDRIQIWPDNLTYFFPLHSQAMIFRSFLRLNGKSYFSQPVTQS